MLAALSIRDIVLIDRLDLDFGAGLSVMTGETGAGKSILLDAFALALGARGDAALVRPGADRGQVSALFELEADHPVFALLEEGGVETQGELVLRRIQTPDGRSRAFINDMPVSVQLLRRVGAGLVEIHGQHDDRALTDTTAHRSLLDAFGGLEADVTALQQAYSDWQQADEELGRHQAMMAKAQENTEYLRHALEELETLDPQEDEEASLAEQRQLMMNAERIAEDLSEALDALGGEGTSLARLGAALRKIERQKDSASALLDPVTEALARVLDETNEARETLESALRATAFEPNELEQAEERLFALRAIARKHKLPISELPALTTRIKAELDAVESGEGTLTRLQQAASEAKANYAGLAQGLSAKRKAAAEQLDQAVMAELAPLKLEKASFHTKLESTDLEDGGPAGIDRVAFWVQTNPGSKPGPLMKLASGGELSRFMLALKVVLAARGSAPTLIFDEIDSNVGGATAAAIGERLARLAGDLQVLAVTHAPQVAAQAEGHLLISKQAADGDAKDSVVTRVAVLESGDRREEIARMLAGQTVTDEARAAAERLMEGRA